MAKFSPQEPKISHSAAGGSDGLQFVPSIDDRSDCLPEVVDVNSYPEVIQKKGETDKYYYNPPKSPVVTEVLLDAESNESKPQKRIIWDMSRRTFLLILLGMIVSIAGVGGAVGGTLAAKNKSNASTAISATGTTAGAIPSPSPGLSPTSTKPSGPSTPVASLQTNSLMAVEPVAPVMPSRRVDVVVALPTMSVSPSANTNVCKGRICSRLLSAVAETDTLYRVLAVGNDNNLWTARSDSFSPNAFSMTEQRSRQGPPTAITIQKSKSILDVFSVDQKKALQHQTWDGSSWSGSEDLAGIILSKLSVVKTPYRLQVFGLGAGNVAFMKSADLSSDATYGQWEKIGGIFNTSITAVAWQPEPGRDRTEVLGVGLGGQMHYSWRYATDTSWSIGWLSWNGSFISEPTVAKVSDTRLDIFGIGSDRAAWTRSHGVMFAGDWRHLGGAFSSSLSTVVGRNGTVDVFGLGDDGAIYTRQLVNGTTWSPAWLSLGGSFNSAPEVISIKADSNGLAVFAVGNDSAIWTRERLDDSWYDWQSLGGQFQVT